MGRSLLGTAKTLKAFNRDTLQGYLSTHYRGPDMVVAAAGASGFVLPCSQFRTVATSSP